MVAARISNPFPPLLSVPFQFRLYTLISRGELSRDCARGGNGLAYSGCYHPLEIPGVSGEDPEKALPHQSWLIRGHRLSVDRGSAIVRFSQGKTARSGKQGETLPTSTPSDRPGRWKLLVDRHAQLRRRLIQAPSRGAHSPASALRHAHRVRCLAHHALRTPKPQS